MDCADGVTMLGVQDRAESTKGLSSRAVPECNDIDADIRLAFESYGSIKRGASTWREERNTQTPRGEEGPFCGSDATAQQRQLTNTFVRGRGDKKEVCGATRERYVERFGLDPNLALVEKEAGRG